MLCEVGASHSHTARRDSCSHTRRWKTRSPCRTRDCQRNAAVAAIATGDYETYAMYSDPSLTAIEPRLAEISSKASVSKYAPL